MLSPDLQPKSAFKLTCTAQAPCISVTPSQGQTFHPNSPQGEQLPNLKYFTHLKLNELGLQSFSATTDYDDIAKKKIPMKSFEIFSQDRWEAHTHHHMEADGRGRVGV